MPSTITDRLNGLTTSIAVKAPCKCATMANIALAGLQTIDGVALAARDRVLVKDQTDSRENGIYVATTGNWVRSPDFNSARDAVGGSHLAVMSGRANANSYWKVAGFGPVDIGTDKIDWEPSPGNIDLAAMLSGSGGGNFIKVSHAASYASGTLGARFQHDIYVTDSPYNADPVDPDNHRAIQNAIDSCHTRGGGHVVIPSASTTWRIGHRLEVPTGVLLIGQGKADAAYGIIERPATMLQPTGTDPGVLLPNLSSQNGVKNVSFFCAGNSSAAIQIGEGPTQQDHFCGDSIIEDMLVCGFRAAGAKALDYQAAQRARLSRFYLINNHSAFALGSSVGLTLFSGNVSVTNKDGRAIDATSGGVGAVDFSSYDVYFESCPGQYPFDLRNGGSYRFIGRGCEAMCYADPATITDPAIWNIGPNVSLIVDVNGIDWLSTGDNLAGTLSIINAADGSRFYMRSQTVSMNYARTGRRGAEYQAFRGRPAFVEIDLPVATGTGFKDLQAVRQAYAPLLDVTYTPLQTKARIQYVRNGAYTDNLNPHTIFVPSARNTGRTSGVAYPLVQNGAGSGRYTIDTLPIRTMGSGREIALEIAGFTNAGGGPGNMSASLEVICGGTTTVPISAVSKTSRAFKARVSLKCIARTQWELEVEYIDGTTASFTRHALSIDNVVDPLQLAVTAQNAAAGDATTISTVTMDRH